MAALTKTYAHGKNGNIAGVGDDSAYPHKFKSSAWSLQFDVEMEDVSGYGDGGFKDFCCSTVEGSVAISGWVLTTGAPGIPSCSNAITLVLTCDTGDTYTGSFVVMQTRIDHRYNKCVPFFLAGKFKGTVTEAGFS